MPAPEFDTTRPRASYPYDCDPDAAWSPYASNADVAVPAGDTSDSSVPFAVYE